MRRPREEEVEEEPFLDWHRISADVWQYIFRFLSADDLKNASQVSKEIARGVRRTFFRTFRFKLTPEMFNNPHFRNISSEIEKISCADDTIILYFPQEVNVFDVILTRNYFGNILPDRVKRLELPETFNSRFGGLPKELTHLKTGDEFNQPVANILPYTLENLHLLYQYSHSLDGLPYNLQVLKLGDTQNFLHYSANFSIHNLPPRLRELYIINADFNLKISKLLPVTLRVLKLQNTSFNHSVKHLPPNLEELELTPHFNHTVDELPKTLTKISLGRYFNQSVNRLPDSLTELILGGMLNQDFNLPITKLPENLRKLELPGLFNQPIEYVLPNTLEYLQLGHGFSQSYARLPSNLRVLKLGNTNMVAIDDSSWNRPLDTLPWKLEELHIYFGKFDQAINNQLLKTLRVLTLYETTFNGDVSNLPSNLQHLEIVGLFNQPVDNLPPNLKTLILGGLFNQPIDYILPPQLNTLFITDAAFNFPVDHLPAMLQYLDFGGKGLFDQPVDHLPPNLISLDLGSSFNQTIDHLPRNLQRLSIGDEFDQSLSNLPPTLKDLDFGSEFSGELDRLPLTLERISLGIPLNENLSHPIDLRYLPNLKYVDGDVTDEDVLVNPGVRIN